MGISRTEDHVYTNGDVAVPSVTDILGHLDEDTSALDGWKDDHDGAGDTFHHYHVYWYSAARGTLCHYQALRTFEDHYDGDDMWGPEETASMQRVLDGPTDDDGIEFDEANASTDLDDITYSILKYQGVVTSRDQYEHLFLDNTRLIDVLHEDVEYFVDAFHEICDELAVTDESIIRVEKLMIHDDELYGGQTDLVYEDPQGNVVVVDLKTSSSFRHKHRLQVVAYKHAVEDAQWGPDDVDRVEVWRIDPDNESWQVHSHEVPSHLTDLDDQDDTSQSSYTDAYWFDDKWGDFTYDDLDDMWATFRDLRSEVDDSEYELA